VSIGGKQVFLAILAHHSPHIDNLQTRTNRKLIMITTSQKLITAKNELRGWDRGGA
jgi:hypothetical protein